MAKFAKQSGVRLNAPIQTTTPTLTHEGGAGWSRDPKSDLFLLAVSNMVGEQTFYESASTRDKRFVALIHQVVAEDAPWVARFIPYLRNTMNMRSASVVMAAEYVRAKGKNGRSVVASALARADEPAEILAYWAQTYGRHFPQPLKRGVADAVLRLYTEKAALKYGANNHAWTMADVIELVHPKPKAPWQSALYRYLIDSRHNRTMETGGELLPFLGAVWTWRQGQEQGPPPEGVTWEMLSSFRTMNAADWEQVIPQMGYMALLRNLRNFDEAGISSHTAAVVAARLQDAEEVARSRQFPIRFYSAMKAVRSLRWHSALEEALNLTLVNVPVLKGRTLILVDDSGSMDNRMSARSTVARREIASLFGSALALRAENPTLVAYATQGYVVPVPKGGAVLPLAMKVANATSGGTNTFQVLRAAYSGHDRVVILTDEQAFRGPDVRYIQAPIYTFNLAGYSAAHLESGVGRYTFGGLTDAGFTLLSILESRKDGSWPF